MPSGAASQEEQEQEQHDTDTELDAESLDEFGHPGHERGQVGDVVVVLLRFGLAASNLASKVAWPW